LFVADVSGDLDRCHTAEAILYPLRLEAVWPDNAELDWHLSRDEGNGIDESRQVLARLQRAHGKHSKGTDRRVEGSRIG
jgi:hypothetical protein